MGTHITTDTNRAQRLLETLGQLDGHYSEDEVYLRSILSPKIVESLIGVLATGNARQCVDAIRLLEISQDPGAISPLLAMQKHEHPGVRVSAAKALGSLPHWAAVSGLIDWLQTERSVMVQPWLVMSLGRLGDPDSVPYLITALHQTESSTMRYTIIRALGMIGDSQAVSAIMPYADDPDPHVQKDVEEALIKLHRESGD